MSGPLAITITEGPGAPLVLLHGIATDSSIWEAVTPALARDRRVVAVDLPGFGHSAPVGDGFDLDEVARAILAGLGEAGLDGPFALVGHSLGGAVAITLAATAPERIRRLVLVAPAGVRPFPAALATLIGSEAMGPIVSSGADVFLAARRGAAALTELGWGRRLLLGLSVANGSQVPPAVARGMLEASLSARRTGPALATITSTDLRGRLSATRMPLGVIWGESDLTVPIRALEDVLSARPDAQVVRFAETGHVPMVEAPDAFAEALQRLLNNDTSPVQDASTLR